MALVKVATTADVPPGHTKEVTVSGNKVLLCNVDGHLYAVGDVCSHDNGPLGQGALDGHAIECPRHGARFDVRTGKVVCLPAILPIPTYVVKVEGADVFVDERAPVVKGVR